jgi:anti-sigma regulatory factor (Ser/Thr protein kinase)
LAGFCRYSGLAQLVGGPPPDPDHPENETVPLCVHRQATFLDAKPILDLVARHIEDASSETEFQEDIRTCVTETIQNVVDHAASPVGGISCARFKKGRVAVAVADLGVGIAVSLRRRFPDIADELDAMGRIARAEGGRGLTALSRESNAGLGLHWLRTIVERRRGSLFLMSGNAFASVTSGGSGWSIERMTPRFGGTAVFFSLPAHES